MAAAFNAPKFRGLSPLSLYANALRIQAVTGSSTSERGESMRGLPRTVTLELRRRSHQLPTEIAFRDKVRIWSFMSRQKPFTTRAHF